MTFSQKLIFTGIIGRVGVRESFKHGRISLFLTAAAVYACGCEIIHDFHLVEHGTPAHDFFSMLGTKHAVGIIALSHLTEHTKEFLEASEKPKFTQKERIREQLSFIFDENERPDIPRYLRKHHRAWKCVRKDLGGLNIESKDARTVDPTIARKRPFVG
jgi:hypothetical protein